MSKDGVIRKGKTIWYDLIKKEYAYAYILDSCRKGVYRVALELDADSFNFRDRIYLVNMNDAVKLRNRYILFYDLKAIRNMKRSDIKIEDRVSGVQFVDQNDKIDGKKLYSLLSTNIISTMTHKKGWMDILPALMSTLTFIIVLYLVSVI
jgi:hypothetical protein